MGPSAEQVRLSFLGLLSGEASWFIRSGLCTYLLAKAPLG